MQIRVKHFINGYWVVQRKVFGIFWIAVTKTLACPDLDLLEKRHPLIFRDLSDAKKEAARLYRPEEMRKHIATQKLIYQDAKAELDKRKAGRKQKFYFT